MKKYLIFLLLFTITTFLYNCSVEPQKSLFDENHDPGTPPVISEILSAFPRILAGVDELTINGTGFSAVLEENGVLFNDVYGEIISASPTQLIVKTPLVWGDSVKIKIWNRNAEGYATMADSNLKYIKILQPVVNIYEFRDDQMPMAITADADSGFYLSMKGAGVFQITPSGSLIEYAAKKGVESYYTGMKIGPGHTIIEAWGTVKALFQAPDKIGEEIVTPITYAVVNNAGLRLADMDYDKYLNLWTAGEGTTIARIKEDPGTGNKEITQFDFDAAIRSVRVYDDYVYLAGNVNDVESVWRAQIISETSLGPILSYFTLSSISGYEENRINAITFSDDGYMYIGTDNQDPILELDVNTVTAKVFYPGVVPADVRYFAWDNSKNLYITKGKEGDLEKSETIFQIKMHKNSAPYFGRDAN